MAGFKKGTSKEVVEKHLKRKKELRGLRAFRDMIPKEGNPYYEETVELIDKEIYKRI